MKTILFITLIIGLVIGLYIGNVDTSPEVECHYSYQNLTYSYFNKTTGEVTQRDSGERVYINICSYKLISYLFA